MENASKALLIAAAVLIVILLIAFGMSIFNSTGSVGEDATDTGAAISNQAGQAANKATDTLKNLSTSEWLK